ncbi:MAG: hypothetical protein AAGH89_14505 [Verrucomicrobiota bacterium]
MNLINDHRSVTYQIVFGVTAVIVGWALIHAQMVVRIAPDHYTKYHEPLGDLENPVLIAAGYGIGASWLPGLLLGIAAALLGRGGSRYKVSPRSLILGSVVLVIATEIIAVLSGIIVYFWKDVFYPESWFPVMTASIQISQTIQVTMYLAISVFSAVLFLGLHVYRNRHTKN